MSSRSAERDDAAWTAVLVQEAPQPRRLDVNVARVVELVAAHPRADLVVFPELYLSGYQTTGLAELAIALDDARLAPVSRAAREHATGVIVGAIERLESGVANNALCFDSDGTLVHSYRKTHLFGIERDLFVAGERLDPVELGGIRLGVEICFDMEFPEVARSLALADVQALVTISANMEPFAPDHAVYARARAMENGLPHLYVNRNGAESGLQFVGESVALDADARVIASAAQADAALEATLSGGGRTDPRTSYLRQRRPDIYGAQR